MVKKKGTHKKRTYSLLIYTAIAMSFMMSCVTTQTGDMAATEEKIPVIKKVVVDQYPLTTIVELISSDPSPYASYKLTEPPRLILDLRGEPGPDLPIVTKVYDSNVNDISFEKGVTQSYTTRMTVSIKDKVEYTITSEENMIKLSFFSKLESTTPSKSMKETIKPVQSTMASEKPEVVPSEPRVMFKPTASEMNKILGIDFTMLEHGKSRLTVTTDKKTRYDMDRKGEKTLQLTVYDVTIPSILLRQIDTTQFESALDHVTPSFSKDKKDVNIEISLREMVPFHVKQTTEGISMDFGQTSVKPPDKKIKTIDMTAIQAKNLAAEQPSATPSTTMVSAVSTEQKTTPKQATTATMAEQPERVYSGERMYLDFNNEDVTNILRLINVVSKENIIWDPAISGRKVSMILKDVPWDQALELILKNNDLAKRYVGENIIWVTTKAKMRQILAEEEAEAQRIQRQLQEDIQKQEEKEEKAKAEAPLITEYLPVDFASASEIQDHITLTDRGTMSVDARTNTIIVRDTAESIEEAKTTIKQFDTPVKQIVIEARIVDASENFSRDLGLQWNSTTSGWRKNINTDVTVPADANDLEYTGERVYGGSFSTNSPDSWAANIGLNFARVTSSGLGTITLDAALALAESEGSAKTLSAPKVIAREGTSATISSGDSIIIPATENVASTTLDATLSLTVTPSAVSFNDYITLDVNVTDDQAPSTSRLIRKSISTTLMVKSGETVVIGGIIKESEGEDVSGVPVLKDVPGLGWLFKAKRKTNTKSELLIFLTPTVLPTPVKSF